MHWVYFNLFSSITVWLCILICTVAAVLPDIVLMVIDNVRNNYKITKQKIIEEEQLGKAVERVNINITNNFSISRNNSPHLNQITNSTRHIFNSSIRPAKELPDNSDIISKSSMPLLRVFKSSSTVNININTKVFHAQID